VPNFIKIGQTVADIKQIHCFKNGGRLPFWTCWALVGTTHDDHMVVSNVMPNLVKIDAVVSMTVFCLFGLKTPIHPPPKKNG